MFVYVFGCHDCSVHFLISVATVLLFVSLLRKFVLQFGDLLVFPLLQQSYFLIRSQQISLRLFLHFGCIAVPFLPIFDNLLRTLHLLVNLIVRALPIVDIFGELFGRNFF
jgi:hypothetical protein